MSRFDGPIPPDAPPVPAGRARRLLRRAFALAAPEWRPLALGVACLIVASATMLAFPQAIRLLVDGALAKGSRHVIDQAALIMLAVGVVAAASSAMRYVLFIVSGERVVARLRSCVYAKLVEQEIAFFDEHKIGDLSSRLAADTSVLQTAVSANLSMLLRNGASALGATIMLMFTSWRLTLVMAAVVPAVALGAVVFGRRVRRYSRAVQDALGSASSIGEESLVGIRTVRVFAAESAEVRRYAAAIKTAFELAKKRTIVTGVFMAIGMAASLGAIALVMWYGGRLVIDGSMSVGQLTSFLVYTMVVAFSLGALGELWADFMRAAGAAERVFEILDREPAIASDVGGEHLEHVRGMIDLAGVDFAYPSRPDSIVLRGLDLHVEPGEVIAIVGRSGAGKSTIGALLSRLYDPLRGTIRLDGRDVRELDPKWLRRQVGVVSQEPLLFSTTIADNVRYGCPDATQEAVERAARVANAHDFIASFKDGYQTHVGERGVQLSGGQKQRIAIARAVLKDPKVLILDEATSALDSESEHLVQEALARLLEGRTTLIIAHRLSTVKDADRVLVLDEGRVVQQGTHMSLLGETGLYRQLIERQFAA